MELTNKTAAELKELALTAIRRQDRATLGVLKVEALRRAEMHQAAGTSTPKLDQVAAKLR